MSRQNRGRTVLRARAWSRGDVEDASPGQSLGTDDPGPVRDGLARVLAEAYSRGLLSSETLSCRLDRLVEADVIDPAKLIDDLAIRVKSRGPRTRAERVSGTSTAAKRSAADPRSGLLVVRWASGDAELLIGRDPRCEIVLGDVTVSRRHARLICRDGNWIVQDLDSTNGTAVNGVAVGRCELRPGDQLSIGDTVLWLE